MPKRKYCGIPTPIQPQTNLSISLTGADDFAEGNNSVYTISWTLTGVIGSPNTVLTATLPAGITFVSASGGGSESGGVITWSLGDIISNDSRTFTITSSTPDNYELQANITGDYQNLGTASDSKEIEVTAAPAGTEIFIQQFLGTITDIPPSSAELYIDPSPYGGTPIDISSYISLPRDGSVISIGVYNPNPGDIITVFINGDGPGYIDDEQIRNGTSSQTLTLD